METICRAIRDGALEGEHAPALTIKDTITSPFGLDVLSHVVSQLTSHIVEGKSQSKGLVIVSFSRSPSFYLDFLLRTGLDVATSHKWIQILDCYTNPLGWNIRTKNPKKDTGIPNESSNVSSCKDAQDMEKLFAEIIELGRGLAGQSKVRFSIVIDSVSEMLRHASLSSVAGLLSNLRSHDQVSSMCWLLHSDLHEDKVTATLEYLSSMMACIEPLNQPSNGQRGNFESLSLNQQNFGKGQLNVRFKRRNGRVRVMWEEFNFEQSGIKFRSTSIDDEIMNQGLLPKVQFNLQLSEKERMDRENVKLPFEHQGNGKPIQIYDGRRSLMESKNEAASISSGPLPLKEESGKGEIIYFRDSDNEMLDSDEDPDDDLDI